MIATEDIEAGGLRFRTDLAGPEDGPLALFLHGFPNSRHSWRAQLEHLAGAGYRCAAPDQRGYSPGARPAGVASYDAALIVQDAVDIAAALGADRFHLVGHDWGGQIAWLTAIAHPGRLLSLSVLSRPHPAAFARAFREDPAQANRSRHHKAFQDPGMADRLLADGAAPLRNTLVYENASGLFGPGDGREGKRRMSDEVAEAHLSVLRDRDGLDAALNWYRAAFGGGSTLARPDAPKVAARTLYLWGNEDMSVGRMAAEATADFVRGPYRFVEIDGAGHFLAEETPDRVNAELRAHLEAADG
jgi:pimeloyl-ACP methyl ester carboxylesterase